MEDLIGEEREENRLLTGAVESIARERTDVRPGTVLMGEEDGVVPVELPNIVLYGRGDPNMLKEDFGEVGGVRPIDVLSR